MKVFRNHDVVQVLNTSGCTRRRSFRKIKKLILGILAVGYLRIHKLSTSSTRILLHNNLIIFHIPFGSLIPVRGRGKWKERDFSGPTAMDSVDSEGGKGRNGSALSVNKLSTKINKSLQRRTVTQPRPAPQVYKTEPADFRSLVQQLTGTSPAEATTSPTGKPLNSRLHKFAPTPLRPVFSYPSVPTVAQQQQYYANGFNAATPRKNGIPPVMNPYNQCYPQRPSPGYSSVPPLSFSPLPALSPGDHVWANVLNPLESPRSVALRQLVQSMAEGGDGRELSKRENLASLLAMMPPPNASNFQNPNFHLPGRLGGSLSPRFPSPFNLPGGPGMPPGFGFGSAFGFGNGQFSPSAAALASMDSPFSFAEPDISSSAYSWD